MTSDDRDTSPVETRPEASRSSSVRPPKKHHLPLWQETILLLGVALVLAVVIKTFFVQAFYIPSQSMEPGLILNDRILIEKVSYWGDKTPARGDQVVFKDPGGWLQPIESAGPANPVARAMAKIGLYPTGGHLVKRVVGVAGDTIECCDDEGRLVINGQPLDEGDFVKRSGETCDGPMPYSCDKPWSVGPIPEGHVFVMGDNRAQSMDSSAHMCTTRETECVPGDEFVPVDLVVGKVFVLLWPADRFSLMSRPDTFEDVPDAKD